MNARAKIKFEYSKANRAVQKLLLLLTFLMDQKARFKYLVHDPLPEDMDMNTLKSHLRIHSQSTLTALIILNITFATFAKIWNLIKRARDYNPWPERIYHFPGTFQGFPTL
jgi:hypothetical protein